MALVTGGGDGAAVEYFLGAGKRVAGGPAEAALGAALDKHFHAAGAGGGRRETGAVGLDLGKDVVEIDGVVPARAHVAGETLVGFEAQTEIRGEAVFEADDAVFGDFGAVEARFAVGDGEFVEALGLRVSSPRGAEGGARAER